MSIGVRVWRYDDPELDYAQWFNGPLPMYNTTTEHLAIPLDDESLAKLRERLARTMIAQNLLDPLGERVDAVLATILELEA